MIELQLSNLICQGLKSIFSLEVEPSEIQIQKTRSEFEGDFTWVVFPFVKVLRKSPEAIANEIGAYLKSSKSEVESFNVIKGFLNVSISSLYWISFVREKHLDSNYGTFEAVSESPVVIEFSSPNTNKPLHLGHIRNNLLGFSISRIVETAGKRVKRVNLVNDRGIHICKSMLAWQKWGNNETPESSGIKGDHLVGKYYVIFDTNFKSQIAEMVSDGKTAEDAARNAPLMLEAQQMLQKWESGDDEIRKLWQTMNNWVYDGFDATYKTLGIEFDKTYYESQTYLLGKDLVNVGLSTGVFTKRDDGSVWIDLSSEGLDEKLLLRSDGTSVYITQDLGTANQRYQEFQPEQLIYVVGNEQEYHFSVLKNIIKHLGFEWYNSIYHLSYGMVELPEGKMKSREGTVVDADDLMQTMFETAEQVARELGKIEDFTSPEALKLYSSIGLGALKYFILKVDPRRNMLFNPAESIDFNGNTGPFIQYTYARIRSVLRKAGENGFPSNGEMLQAYDFEKLEMELLKRVYDFPATVEQAAQMLSPAVIANYTYDLACVYNRFYHELTILKETNELKRTFRLAISQFAANTIAKSMWLLGIDVPERM